MKILGFEVGKKTIIAVGVVVAVVAIASTVTSVKQNKEKQARIEEEKKRIEEQKKSLGNQEEYTSYDDMLQAELREEFGDPPEGFKWSLTGELEAVSSDDKSAEDVLFSYIRSLSIQDFATAQRYSQNSKVYETYTDYFSEVSKVVTDYYSQFLRKQYSFAMKSIENLGVEGVATLADGTQIMSVKLKLLDLTDKDFWQKDKLEIYKQMRVYSEQESDDAKKEQYLYDYVYKCYENGTIGKREVVIDFKVGKQSGGGWLVVDDSELNSYLSYEKGTDVARYILNTYEKWLLETTIEEQRQYLEQQKSK